MIMATASTKPKLISIFDAIRQNPRFHQSRSAVWFREKIKALQDAKIAKIDEQSLLKATRDQQFSQIFPSSLMFFSYDPKYKKTLPYYDMFPLSFILSRDKETFTGINFHYLPIPIRIKLYDKMWHIASNSHLPTQQVLQLNWGLLKAASKFPEVIPAVKKYRFDHVRSRFIRIDIQDWKTAIMLENAQFRKMSAGNVRTESARMIAKALSGN